MMAKMAKGAGRLLARGSDVVGLLGCLWSLLLERGGRVCC